MAVFRHFASLCILISSLLAGGAAFADDPYAGQDPQTWFDYRALRGHSIKLLPDGATLRQARLDLIAQARNTIYLSAYSYQADPSALEISDALCRRAKDGLDVRVFLDHRDSKDFLGDHADRLRKCGARVLSFNPWGWDITNFRMTLHEKLLITDGLHYITGGSGYADYYNQASRDDKEWHDLNFQVSGPAACWYHRRFVHHWSNTAAMEINPDWKIYQGEQGQAVMERVFGLKSFRGCKFVPQGESRVYPLLDNPTFDHRQMILKTHLAAIRASHMKIRLYSPYFIPDDEIVAALVDARKRHVEVTILTNSPISSDESFSTLGMYRKAEPLLKAGIQVRIWNKENMLHRKGGVYDGRWAWFGSDNLDRAAHVYNSEDISITDDPEIVRQLDEEMDLDLATSHPLDKAAMNREIRHHSVFQHLIISRILDFL